MIEDNPSATFIYEKKTTRSTSGLFFASSPNQLVLLAGDDQDKFRIIKLELDY